MTQLMETSIDLSATLTQVIHSFTCGIAPHAGSMETEEYKRNIPIWLRNRNGIPGDELADVLHRERPELGIESEDDLHQLLAAGQDQRRRQTTPDLDIEDEEMSEVEQLKNELAQLRAELEATKKQPATHTEPRQAAPTVKRVEIVKEPDLIGLRFSHKPQATVKDSIKKLGFTWTETLFWTMRVNGNKADVLAQLKLILQ